MEGFTLGKLVSLLGVRDTAFALLGLGDSHASLLFLMLQAQQKKRSSSRTY